MDTTNLKVYLPFDESTTRDLCGNTWTATGSPIIEDSALKLNGSSYLQSQIQLGGQDFTLRGKFNMTSSTAAWGRLFEFNVDGGSSRFELIRNKATNNLNINGYTSWASSQFEAAINTSVLNQTVDIECDYIHADGKLYVFYDGILKQTINVTFTRKQVQYVRLGASKYESNRCFTGSIDEFQIYDGVALHTDNFTPPTAQDYLQLKLQLDGQAPFDFTADVERRISTRVEFDIDIERRAWKKWRYVNRGDADDLIIASTVLTDLPITQSKTGTAFYQTTQAKCFDLPATDEVWIKFDVYFDGTNRWRAYNGGTNGVTGITAQTTGDLSFFSNGSNVQQPTGICIANQLQTVLLHMKSGSSNGVIEAWIDGELIHTFTGDVNHGEDFADIYLQSDGAGTFFSNVIISNVEISQDAEVTIVEGGYAVDGKIFIRTTLDAERVLTNATWSPVPSLKVYMPFDISTTQDWCGNEWTANTTNYNQIVSETGTINGNALQIHVTKADAGVHCLSNEAGLWLGGKSFTIKGSFTLTSFPDNNNDGGWRLFILTQSFRRLLGYEVYAGANISVAIQNSKLYFSCLEQTTKSVAIELNTTYSFEYVYHYGLGKVFAFLNGKLIETIDTTISRKGYGYFYIDYAPWQGSHGVGALDEFKIYDGAALHTEEFTALTPENYIDETLTLEKQVAIYYTTGIEREITNDRQTVKRYISFTGASGCYGLLPLGVLAGAKVFTIEV